MTLAPLTPAQLNYIDVLLPLSDEDLLYEIASTHIMPIYASADMPSQEEMIKRHRDRVPTAPVAEVNRPLLSKFLGMAERDVALFRRRLYNLLCDVNTKQPSNLVVEATTGPVKDLVAAVVPILCVAYSSQVTLAIAATVTILRYGLPPFCAAGLDTPQPPAAQP